MLAGESSRELRSDTGAPSSRLSTHFRGVTLDPLRLGLGLGSLWRRHSGPLGVGVSDQGQKLHFKALGLGAGLNQTGGAGLNQTGGAGLNQTWVPRDYGPLIPD